MSVDAGLARTGIAVSDASESFAFPKTVIYERNTERLVEKICEQARECDAKLIVVGYPKNMDGSCGERAKACEELAEQISNAGGIETVLRDERCTTISAHKALNDTDVRGKKRKAVVDAVAATIILQDYLDYRKNTHCCGCG